MPGEKRRVPRDRSFPGRKRNTQRSAEEVKCRHSMCGGENGKKDPGQIIQLQRAKDTPPTGKRVTSRNQTSLGRRKGGRGPTSRGKARHGEDWFTVLGGDPEGVGEDFKGIGRRRGDLSGAQSQQRGEEKRDLLHDEKRGIEQKNIPNTGGGSWKRKALSNYPFPKAVGIVNLRAKRGEGISPFKGRRQKGRQMIHIRLQYKRTGDHSVDGAGGDKEERGGGPF